MVDAGSTGNQNTGEAILQIDVGVLRERCLWTLKTSVSDGIPVTQNKHALHRETFKQTMKIIYILSVPQTFFRVANINVCWNSSSLNDSATFLTLILCFREVFFFINLSLQMDVHICLLWCSQWNLNIKKVPYEYLNRNMVLIGSHWGIQISISIIKFRWRVNISEFIFEFPTVPYWNWFPWVTI